MIVVHWYYIRVKMLKSSIIYTLGRCILMILRLGQYCDCKGCVIKSDQYILCDQLVFELVFGRFLDSFLSLEIECTICFVHLPSICLATWQIHLRSIVFEACITCSAFACMWIYSFVFLPLLDIPNVNLSIAFCVPRQYTSETHLAKKYILGKM